ncbi:hypothetical protein AgCh_024114 [Apium graveolens]
MDDTTVNVRLHYEGKFKKTSYVGGKHFIVMGLDVESFSYYVLMELVKDNLHFTEIGRIYASRGRKGGWQLLSNDKKVMALVEDCAPGYLVNFYIDNIVDKQIEPAPQIQPHVITRPRESFIQASPEKPLKHKKLALEPCAGDVEDTGNKDVVEKLPPPPPLCEYEKLKLDKMRANNEVYKSLGLPQIVSTFKDAVESSNKSKGKKGKETAIEEDDSQYVPTNEGDVESDDSSELAAMVRLKQTARKTCDADAYVRAQSNNDGPAPGTIAAYFPLRDRQMNNDEAPMNQNVVKFEMEQNADEEVQEVRAPRKRRGPTKMTRVHGRNPNEKVVISLNANGQAISDIEGSNVQSLDPIGFDFDTQVFLLELYGARRLTNRQRPLCLSDYPSKHQSTSIQQQQPNHNSQIPITDTI